MQEQRNPEPETESETAPRKPMRRGIVLIAIGIAIGIAADHYLTAPRITEPAQSTEQAVAPAFTRVGDRITVPPDSALRSMLTVADVEQQSVAHTLVLPAVVEADPARTVKVLPPVAGRVVELKVQLGERVTQGQDLAVIDSGDLAQAYSDDEKARTLLTLTKQTLERQLGLEKGGGGTIKDREQAQSDYAQAQAEFSRAETKLRSMGVSADQLEKTRLLTMKAPVTGSIIELDIAPGAFLNDATATAMMIANLDTIWVTANVPEKDTSFIFTGQSVSVQFPAYPGKMFDGKVLFVSDVLEPDTRRTKVRIAFDNPDKALKPNMFANATFTAPAESRLVVPTSALLMVNDTTSVFVEVAPWAFERRNVDLDYQEGDTATIKSGLKAGDRVVVKGGIRLND
jgi:membrane fusion protein, heavy metal efflux system